MLHTDTARAERTALLAENPFVLYVEGPRDRSILRAWAHRLMPRQTAALLEQAVILGGRRPARALTDFRKRAAGARGLCVLDRDEGDMTQLKGEGGLQFFTWGRRHIESYLLVPTAIRRALGLSPTDHRLETALCGELPADDDLTAWSALDAKRLLSPNGTLARVLGKPLPLARIARTTREDELHADVHDVFARLRECLTSAVPARPRGAFAPSRHR